MKHTTSTLKNFFTRKVDIFSLCAGVTISLLVISLLHCAMRSFSHRAWKGAVYGHKNMMMESRDGREDRSDWKKKNIINNTTVIDHSKMNMNPYIMGDVTSEKQFLTDMVLHHKAAVTMAEQVLKLPSLQIETKTLAETIIKAQSDEIKSMNEWLTLWK